MMNNMLLTDKIGCYSLLLIVLLCALSCTTYKGEDTIPPSLSTDVNELLFLQGGSRQSLVLESGKKWSIESQPDWVSVLSAEDKGHPYRWALTVEVKANSGNARDGLLTFSTRDERINVNVIQQGVEITSITISTNELTLKEGESTKVVFSTEPTNASDKTIEWTSSDPEVASVSYGVIYALKAGEATITAKSITGDCSASCKVTVVCPVQGVKISNHNVTLKVGQSTTLDAEVYPGRACDRTVHWSSDNNSVATVSAEGIVTGVASGTAKITVRTTDGDFTDECTVTVVSDVEGIILNRTEAFELVVDETFDFVATIKPKGATNQTVFWSSTNPEVASVNENGHVVALSAGETIISATSQDGGHHAFCTVRVRNKVDRITISQNKVTIYIGGDGVTLTYTISPSDAGNVNIVWRSSNETVATVDQNGHVTAKGKGAARIYASTTTGDVNDSCEVTVLQPVTSISVNPAFVVMWVGESRDLAVTLGPADADDLNYSVSITGTNKDAISFTKIGNKVSVIALKVGTAKIQLIPVLRSVFEYAECEISVRANVSSVSLNRTSITLTEGESETLTAQAFPSDADQSFTWSTNNRSVATVDSNGKVTAVAPGSAVITATAASNSSKKAECSVTVKKHVSFEAVDLGLSVKWASFNIGATAPEECGDYFAWGETKPYYEVGYAQSTQPVWREGKEEGYSWTSYSYGDSNGVTAIDANNILSLDVDAASVNCGGLWRIPTVYELRELCNPDNCSWTRTTWHGTVGYRVTSKIDGYRGNFIFIPAAGFRYSVGIYRVDEDFFLWSSVVDFDSHFNAYYLYSLSGAVGWKSINRYRGYSIRPVYGQLVRVTNLAIDNSKNLTIGERAPLIATIIPSNASEKTLVWSSSNTKVATVDDSGVVDALSVGTAVITAKTLDGNYTSSCQVTVN